MGSITVPQRLNPPERGPYLVAAQVGWLSFPYEGEDWSVFHPHDGMVVRQVSQAEEDHIFRLILAAGEDVDPVHVTIAGYLPSGDRFMTLECTITFDSAFRLGSEDLPFRVRTDISGILWFVVWIGDTEVTRTPLRIGRLGEDLRGDSWGVWVEPTPVANTLHGNVPGRHESAPPIPFDPDRLRRHD